MSMGKTSCEKEYVPEAAQHYPNLELEKLLKSELITTLPPIVIEKAMQSLKVIRSLL